MKITQVFCDLCQNKTPQDAYTQQWILTESVDICNNCQKTIEKALKSRNFWASIKEN
jgi:hypothetical protein